MAQKTIIRLKISSFADREKIIAALANSGYAVWVEEEQKERHHTAVDYYVCFKLKPYTPEGGK